MDNGRGGMKVESVHVTRTLICFLSSISIH